MTENWFLRCVINRGASFLIVGCVGVFTSRVGRNYRRGTLVRCGHSHAFSHPLLYHLGVAITTTRSLSRLCMMTIRYFLPFPLSFTTTQSPTTLTTSRGHFDSLSCHSADSSFFHQKSLLLVRWARLRSHMHFIVGLIVS
jgi:hypothetical protein